MELVGIVHAEYADADVREPFEAQLLHKDVSCESISALHENGRDPLVHTCRVGLRYFFWVSKIFNAI